LCCDDLLSREVSYNEQKECRLACINLIKGEAKNREFLLLALINGCSNSVNFVRLAPETRRRADAEQTTDDDSEHFGEEILLSARILMFACLFAAYLTANVNTSTTSWSW
jgi:hypothetical protein